MELVQGRPLSAVIDELRRGATRPSEESLAILARRDGAPAGGGAPDAGTRTGDRAYFVRVAELFAGVADALDLAHHERIIHRDIKPSNLLLDADGVLKIVDFGLARFADESLSMTVTGELLGTPLYMSPEQALAKRTRIDHRTDVYSLGATLYEVLTLRPPFEAENLQELCSQIVTEDPVLPRRTNRRVPPDLETIVCKAMEKDRDKRYQSAREMARDLRAFAEGGAIRARRIGPAGRAWRKVKRHKVRFSLAAAVLVLAAAGTILGLYAAGQAAQRRVLAYARLCALAEQAAIGSGSRPREELEEGTSTGEDLFGEAIALMS